MLHDRELKCCMRAQGHVPYLVVTDACRGRENRRQQGYCDDRNEPTGHAPCRLTTSLYLQRCSHSHNSVDNSE